MSHSNQIREFRLTNKGIELTDVYLGSAGLLTGAAREVQEARERAEALTREQEIERKQRDLQRKRQAFEAQINALRASFEAEEAEIQQVVEQAQSREDTLQSDQEVMARIRKSENLFSVPVLRNGTGKNYEENPQSPGRKKGKAKAKRVRK
jgi:circadian clock protein KaiC